MSATCPASVVLIEDDDLLRKAIAAFLESRGYATLPAESVEHAITLLPTADRPCLILVDPLNIPADWAALFRVLTSDDRVATLPMVLVSINAPDLLIRPYLVKRPLDFEILFRIAQEHCCGGDREPGKPSGHNVTNLRGAQ